MYKLPKTGGFMMLGSFLADTNVFTYFAILLVSILIFRIARLVIRERTYNA